MRTLLVVLCRASWSFTLHMYSLVLSNRLPGLPIYFPWSLSFQYCVPQILASSVSMGSHLHFLNSMRLLWSFGAPFPWVTDWEMPLWGKLVWLIVGLTLFLFSQGSQFCAACCPMSEKTFSHIQFSSCSKQDRKSYNADVHVYVYFFPLVFHWALCLYFHIYIIFCVCIFITKFYSYLCVYLFKTIVVPISLSIHINIDIERQYTLVLKNTGLGDKLLIFESHSTKYCVSLANYLIFTYLTIFTCIMG